MLRIFLDDILVSVILLSATVASLLLLGMHDVDVLKISMSTQICLYTLISRCNTIG